MRTQVLSYGGGVQTVAMVALVLKGVLPRPDHIVIADTSYENTSTWDYLDEIVQTALGVMGLRVEIAAHELATVDLFAHNGDLLLPVYTETGKLPTYCSNEWKKRVVQRWLSGRGVRQCDMWIGFSSDEGARVGKASGDTGKWVRTFPLYDLHLSRADCGVIIEEMGWPPPPSSACIFCPNKPDVDFIWQKENYPADLERAAQIEDELRQWDDEIYLHRSRVPLREVVFDPNGYSRKESRHQCSFACMV